MLSEDGRKGIMQCAARRRRKLVQTSAFRAEARKFHSRTKDPKSSRCWNAARATFLHPTTHPTCHAFLVLAPVTVMTALTRSLQSPHLTSRLLAQAARSICSRHLLAAAAPSSLAIRPRRLYSSGNTSQNVARDTPSTD